MKKYILFSFLICLSVARVFAQGEGEVVDKIIAKVDNYVILKSDLEAALQNARESGQVLDYQKAPCIVLQQLLIQKMMAAKAEIDSVRVEGNQIESELDRRMQYFENQFGSIQKMEQVLGKTIAQLKEELRPQITEMLTVQKMQDHITEKVKVTPREVKNFFKEIPVDSLPDMPAEVEVGIITKMPQASKQSKENARKLLFDLKQRLLAGEEFSKLAEEFSEDLGSAARGGDLGWATRGSLVPQFEAVAMRIEAGTIADPVESEFGFHLIQLQERQGNRYRSRHILVRPKITDDDLERATVFLDSIRTRILLDSTKFTKAASDFSDDKNTKITGGMMKNPQSKDTKVPLDYLEQNNTFLKEMLDTMQIGTITKSARFRTDDGKDAVRIVYFKSKTEAHQASLKADWQKLSTFALEQEKARIVTEWFDKTKGSLFIDIDPEYDNCELMKNLKQ